MSNDSNDHMITAEEIAEIQHLGYTLHHSPPPPAETFMTQNFNGLDLLTFISTLETLLSGLGIVGINRHIVLSQPPPKLEIIFFNEDYQDDIMGVLFKRSFIRQGSSLTVSHDYLVLPANRRGKGIGKSILATCLEQYINMGVEKIKIFAGLEDGGFVWAKAGFKAVDRSEVDAILTAARNDAEFDRDILATVQSYYDDHYTNTPDLPYSLREWSEITAMEPVLRNSNWHGEIDLTNPEELSNFTRYVSRSKKV